MRHTTPRPSSASWLGAAYWPVVVAVIILGVINILGAFGSASEVVSYITFGLAAALIATRLLLTWRRASTRR